MTRHDHVVAELIRTDVPTQSLVLDLTETTIMINPERAARALERLHEQGVRITIDDFWKGNAGFNYLRDVPADQLKINRGIVQDMVNNPAGAVAALLPRGARE